MALIWRNACPDTQFRILGHASRWNSSEGIVEVGGHGSRWDNFLGPPDKETSPGRSPQRPEKGDSIHESPAHKTAPPQGRLDAFKMEPDLLKDALELSPAEKISIMRNGQTAMDYYEAMVERMVSKLIGDGDKDDIIKTLLSPDFILKAHKGLPALVISVFNELSIPGRSASVTQGPGPSPPGTLEQAEADSYIDEDGSTVFILREKDLIPVDMSAGNSWDEDIGVE